MTSKRCWFVIIAGALARLALGAAIGLGVDESYALAVARPLSLSYYDHPPLVFWLAALSQRVFGIEHDALLRLPFILLYAATTWILYLLTERLFDRRAALIAALLAQLIPVFGVSDGGWILPDGPLLLGFAGTALCLSDIAFAPAKSDVRAAWLAAGLSAGIASLSKYHAVFLIVGTLVFLLTSDQQRYWLRRPDPYLAALSIAVMSLPVFIWNAQHHWASFRFQGTRASPQVGWSLTAVLQNLGGQAGYLLPWIWIPLVWLFVRAALHGPRDTRRWLLVCLGGGPVLFFTLVSLGGRPGLPHWPAPGFFLLIPLLAEALAHAERRGRARAVRLYLVSTTAIVLLLVTFAASQIRTGWFSRRFPQLFSRGDPSLEALDWREIRPNALDSVRPGNHPVIVASSWIDAAKLGAALGADARVLCFNDDARQFRYVVNQQLLIGSDALVILRGKTASVADARRRIAGYFRLVDTATARTITIHRGGVEAVNLLVYRASSLLRPYGSSRDLSR